MGDYYFISMLGRADAGLTLTIRNVIDRAMVGQLVIYVGTMLAQQLDIGWQYDGEVKISKRWDNAGTM